MKRFICVALAASTALASCATAPKGPAADLATAGMTTTKALGADVRGTAARLEYVDVTDAFVGTLRTCPRAARTCPPYTPPEANSQARRRLAGIVVLRARAVDALGKAYSALNDEAAYDGRGDLVGATEAAVSGVNTFASAVAAAGVPAPLLTQPLTGLLSFGAGLIGEHNQRRRILAASRVIGAATLKLRDALKAESEIYGEVIARVEQQRANARTRLFTEGLISGTELMKPMADQLDVKFVPNADALIAKSPRAQAAVTAAMRAMSDAEVAAVQARYRASIDALDALLDAHADLEKKRPISLADVERTLGDLNAALDHQLSKEGK